MKALVSTLLISIIFLTACSTARIQDPEYRDIRNLSLKDVGLLQSTAGIDLIYYNPNGFGVELMEARGDVYIDNAYLGRFDLGEKVDVKKRSEFIVPALIKIDMIGAIKNQRELFKKKEALVRIEGVARVRKAGFSREVPIKYEGMQNIERFRNLVTK